MGARRGVHDHAMERSLDAPFAGPTEGPGLFWHSRLARDAVRAFLWLRDAVDGVDEARLLTSGLEEQDAPACSRGVDDCGRSHRPRAFGTVEREGTSRFIVGGSCASSGVDRPANGGV